jgi:O-antigen/teichoic acid export membrane protein
VDGVNGIKMTKILLLSPLIGLMTFVLTGYWTSGLNPLLSSMISIGCVTILIISLIISIKRIVRFTEMKWKLIGVVLLGVALLLPVIWVRNEMKQTSDSLPRRYYMKKE